MATTVDQKGAGTNTKVAQKQIAGWTEVSQHTGVGTATPISGHSGLTGYTEVSQH